MFAFLARLGISALALYGISLLSNGGIVLKDPGTALVAVLLLGLANALVKPILQFVLGLLTLPLSCLTLGLWSLALSVLINGLMFWLVDSVLPGFAVRDFAWDVVGALGMSVVNALSSSLIGGIAEPKRER